jgi:hypothetical protein
MPWAMRPSNIVKMHGIAICRDFGKQFDVAVRDDFAQGSGHTDFDIFDTDRPAGKIVEHMMRFLGHVALQHSTKSTTKQSCAQDYFPQSLF